MSINNGAKQFFNHFSLRSLGGTRRLCLFTVVTCIEYQRKDVSRVL